MLYIPETMSSCEQHSTILSPSLSRRQILTLADRIFDGSASDVGVGSLSTAVKADSRARTLVCFVPLFTLSAWRKPDPIQILDLGLCSPIDATTEPIRNVRKQYAEMLPRFQRRVYDHRAVQQCNIVTITFLLSLIGMGNLGSSSLLRKSWSSENRGGGLPLAMIYWISVE